MIINTRAGRSTAVLTVLLATLVAGCGVDQQETPSLTGPSELALSVTLTASPNQLPRDGASQSVVTITARDTQGRPVADQRIRLTLPTSVPSGSTLSASEVRTDTNGQATFAVTAASRASIGDTIVITATPVGGNLDSVLSRQISITLTPTNTTRPTPLFDPNPTSPEINQVVTFNATRTTDEGVTCNESCTYQWDFGDSGTASGRIVTHSFQAAGRFVVALTVTDAQGASETLRQNVDVTANGQPTSVSITASPNCAVAGNCVAGRAVSFTAAATAAANHRIVSYSWSWGDGSSNQTTAVGIQHTYSQPGTYLARLTVRDDLGQTSEASGVMFVESGLVATFSNTAAVVGRETTFDAAGSFSGSGTTIQLYTWDWDDATDQSSESPTIAHTFITAGDHIVRLTITDSQGRTASLSRTITVAPAP